MARAFTTVKPVKGKEPFLRRIVCEVRFTDGQHYLDHTGRLLKKLVRNADWVVSPDPTTQGTTAFHMVESLRLAFSMHGASLDLDWSNSDEVIYSEEISRYIAKAEEVLGFVADELEVTEFGRVGIRQWYHFSFDSKEESEQWLRDLRLFSFSSSLVESFDAVPETMAFTLVLEGHDCHYRIALNGVERAAQLPIGDTSLSVRASAVSKKQKQVLIEALKRKRQKQINSSFAVVLDIDTYQNEPKELDLGQFLKNSLEGNLDRFRKALPVEETKKGK